MKLFKKEKILRTPETKRKKEKERRIKLIIFSLLFIILTAGPLYLARMDRFQIKSIQIEGTSVTREEDIEKIIASNLKGNYLWLIPKSNALLYPKKKIEETLLRQIPRLSLASASLLSPESLLVRVAEREPFALYCKRAVIDGAILPEDCYFLDKSGFIFAEAPAFSGDVYHIYTEEPSFENPLGRVYLGEKQFRNISYLIEELKLLGVHGRVFQTKEDEYHLYLPNAGDIKWKDSMDLNQIYSNLSSLLQSKDIASDPTFLDRILYIDMRFGNNKLSYVFRK
ncbi:MAG: hypothetical protein WD874_00175 [Parcubacteria group bacterium]